MNKIKLTYRKFAILNLVSLFFFTLSCMNENNSLDKIRRVSNIYVPDNSKILIYNDNLEFELAFKILIDKNELDDFLISNKFEHVDTVKINSFKRTDISIISEIENSFIPKERIFCKNLKIIKNKKGVLIVNYKASVLWGLVED